MRNLNADLRETKEINPAIDNDDIGRVDSLIKEVLNLSSFQNLSINQNHSNNNNNNNESAEQGNKDDELNNQLIIEKFENLIELAKKNKNLFKIQISAHFYQLYEIIIKQFNNYLLVCELHTQSFNDDAIITSYLEFIHVLCKVNILFFSSNF